MYEETFGTNWETIDGREEAVRRAFALGVAARLGERHAGELDRISREVDSSYDRSFVELAYHEGRNKASDHEAVESGGEEVWEDLVEGEASFDPDLPGAFGPDDEDEGGPPELLEPADIDTGPDDSREAVERPKFLKRSEAEEPDREDRRRRRSSRSSGGDDDSPEITEEDREAFQELLDPSGTSSDGDEEDD